MSPGPQFKKIRKSLHGSSVSSKSKTASDQRRMPLLSVSNSMNRNTTSGGRSSGRLPSRSSTHSTHQTSSSSGNVNGSGADPSSPLADLRAPNDNYFEHGIPISPPPTSTPDSEASRTNALRNFRGATRGINLDSIIEKYGKIKIKFNPLETKPAENEGLFSEGIGVAIRTCAELEDVTRWREVPQGNKDMCLQRLLQWFEIEEWDMPHVQHIVNQAFQVCYRNWRNTLAETYRKLVDKGHDPRDRCPREELQMGKWLAFCDWVECDEFQARSLTNSNNRKHLRSSHRSGKLSYMTRYRKMKDQFDKNLTTVEPSRIRVWKNTHVDKNGNFVNRDAEEKYAKMVEMEEASAEGENPMSDIEILKATLGHRSGYVYGVGSGVVVPCGKFSSSLQQGSELKEKLLETQSELDGAKEKIDSLATELIEQKEKNLSCESKIQNLEKKIQEMEKFMLRFR